VLALGIIAFGMTRGWSSMMRRPQIMAILRW
jgi:hypothetical protein